MRIEAPKLAKRGLLRDRDIRFALHGALIRHREAPDTLVVNELTVAMGMSKIDVAVLNGRLEGYEIKSDRDSLVRLDSQIQQYQEICDRLTVVTTDRYRAAIESIAPQWCGVMVATSEEGVVKLTSLRPALENPNWDILALMLLLWQTETVALARSLGFRAPRTMGKGLIHRQLALRIAHDHLRARVLDCLRQRTTWTPKQLAR